MEEQAKEMTDYLLRVEAVNLGNFVYDTHDISTIRGGGYLLMSVVNELPDKTDLKLEKIFAGASIGLYRFTAAPTEVELVRQAVEETLNKETGGYATFVVDYIECAPDDNFAQRLETLTANNRWSQFKQPTISLPTKPQSACKTACKIELKSPGVKQYEKRDAIGNVVGEVLLSESVHFRREEAEGRHLRQVIYDRILEAAGKTDNPVAKASFTDNLEDLANDPKDQNQTNLNGKIAFIYADGNRFGLVRDTCKNAEDFRIFAHDKVEEARARFIEAILDNARKNDGWKTSGGKIRLETLMWGGDELEIVVPAWKGLEVIKSFYDTIGGLSFNDTPLTHAAGVVFCHHNAPILHVRKLAKNLAELAKDTLPEGGTLTHAEHDRLAFAVLESFDFLGGSTNEYFKEYYGIKQATNAVCRIDDFNKMVTLLGDMKKYSFPRNKLHALARMAYSQLDAGATVLGADFETKLDRALNEVPEPEKGAIKIDLKDFTNDAPWRWLMLADLWDYAEAAT